MIDIKERGAIGNGVSDDTAAIQAVLSDAATDEVWFPHGHYRIDASKGLTIPSNRALIFEAGAMVTGANSGPRCRIFETVPGASGIRIVGALLCGSREAVCGVSWGHCVRIDAASDGELENVIMRDAYTDCIYIGGNTACYGITLRRVICQSARRSALTITNAVGVHITHSTFIRSSGQEPEAGVNCEPNAGERVREVTFFESMFGGSRVGLFIHRGQGNRAGNIRVIDCGFTENSRYGLIATEIDGLHVIGSRFLRSKWGASIGGLATRITFADNRIEECEHALVLSGVESPRVYGNQMTDAQVEVLPAGTRPGVYGRVYIDTEE